MSLPTKAQHKYTVSLDRPQTQTVDITIHVPNLRSDNLTLQTWGSSYILASQLSQITISFPSEDGSNGIQILELGAGTGLVGLSACAIWDRQVVLTDLPGIVPGLATNIAANAALLQGRAACGVLDWERPAELTLSATGHADEGAFGRKPGVLSSHSDKASVILAADCVYWEEHPRLLTKAIFAWLRPGEESRVVIAYPLRVAYLDAIRELWELLEQGGLEVIEEGKAETREDDWDDERWHEWSVWKWTRNKSQP